MIYIYIMILILHIIEIILDDCWKGIDFLYDGWHNTSDENFMKRKTDDAYLVYLNH